MMRPGGQRRCARIQTFCPANCGQVDCACLKSTTAISRSSQLIAPLPPTPSWYIKTRASNSIISLASQELRAPSAVFNKGARQVHPNGVRIRQQLEQRTGITANHQHRSPFRSDVLPRPRPRGETVVIGGEARFGVAQVCFGFVAAAAISDRIWWRSRSISCSTTSSSAAVNRGDGSGEGTAPACFSASLIRSSSILMARRSAVADLLISCEVIASRTAILRRRPFSVTTTFLFSPSTSDAARFFPGRPRGLAEASPCLKRACCGNSQCDGDSQCSDKDHADELQSDGRLCGDPTPNLDLGSKRDPDNPRVRFYPVLHMKGRIWSREVA